MEIELSSGHADRGLVISDRPVVQPVTWVSAGVATFSQPHFYIRQYFQFSTIVNRAVRAELARPTLFFVGLATGVEF